MTIKVYQSGTSLLEQIGKDKTVCTVVDIYTVTNSSGEVVEYKCIAEQPFLSQKIRFETPFTTVIKNKQN